MFAELVAAAEAGRGAGAVAALARLENAAYAHRLAACYRLLLTYTAGMDSAQRDDWVADNWSAVCAEIAAAQFISLGMASAQLATAKTLHEWFPRIAEVAGQGWISRRMVEVLVNRTRLMMSAQGRAKVDAEIAARIRGWSDWSLQRLQTEIDYWVDRYEPFALRRTQSKSRGRHVEVTIAPDGSGVAYIEAQVLATDGDALDQRLDALAATVCEHDPRTLDQRRADAVGVIAAGGDRLGCLCDREDCDAAHRSASAVIVHVIAREEALSDDTSVQLDGATRQPEASDSPDSPAMTDPGLLLGHGILPASVVAAKIAPTARLRYIRHPGESPPESRYRPSEALAWFVRARDLTCRFPGCGVPAHACDLDHAVPWPLGPTQASNLRCLCRHHHLVKTFWGWRDRQHPDGRIEWLSPTGQHYTTDAGAALLFPQLCRPTAPVDPQILRRAETLSPEQKARGLAMPRRKLTRQAARHKDIDTERRANAAVNAARIAKRNQPPPF
ncbi:HNH endonuclease signature motif containing protein [Mycolicibacterium phlei]|nr:HNH endonuclease signature motif containing protein [Mycolicibacterium phlei]